MESFERVAQRLRAAILDSLGLKQPPYYLKVMQDQGDVTVQLFDTRIQGGAYREGKYVAGQIIQPWHDTLVAKHATESAEAMRPNVEAHENSLHQKS